MQGETMEKNRENDDVIEIELGEILHVLLRKAGWIILVGMITALSAFLISEFVMPPIYESTTKIYILNKQEGNAVTYSDVQIGTQLTKDYAELVKSRFVLEDVINQLKLDLTYEQLDKKLDITTPTDTRILAISVEDEDPVKAMCIANAIRETASVHITNVMDIKAVNVVEEANMPEEKAKPHVLQWTLIGGILGALLVCVIVLLRYLLDDTIKSSEDVERYLQLSTLALIPLAETKDGGKGKKSKKKTPEKLPEKPPEKPVRDKRDKTTEPKEALSRNSDKKPEKAEIPDGKEKDASASGEK